MIRYFRAAVFILLALSILAMPGQKASAAQDATPEAECVTTTPEENEALVAAYWAEAVWGPQGKIAAIVASGEIHHWGIAGATNGFEEFAERWALFNAAFAGGELVVVRWSGTATNEGEFLGHPPTGTEVAFTGINVYRLACGQIVESWSEMNTLHVLRQIEEAAAAIAATPSA